MTDTDEKVVQLATVGFVRQDDEGDRYIDWTLEGGIHAVEIGDELIVADTKVTDDEGGGEVYSHSTYAELAAELASYKADTQKLRDTLGDSPAAKLLIELDLLRTGKQAAESQLAELRGRILVLFRDWQDASKHPIYPAVVRDTYTEVANELRALAVADGTTTGETK